jgi:cytosine/adenosine deaminase-related metal-dependent hydrolase
VTSTLFNNVRLFDLTSDAGMGDACDLRIAGGRISDTAPTLAPRSGERVINGKGGLIMPGLINAHFHSSVNHMKGRLPSLPLEIFMLYESPELDVLRPTPREAYLRTMLGIFEMLKTGCTSVQDDCFFVPCPTPEIIDAVAQAYLDSGIRVRLALDQPQVSELDKLPFLQDLLPDDLRQELSLAHGPSASELLDLYDHLIRNWHGRGNGRLKAAVSCSAPQRVTPDYFAALDDLSLKHDLPIYAHMLETKLQRVYGNARLNGRSLVQYTNDLGLLTERMNVIHAIWVDNADLDVLALRGATVAHNPISNLRLGSGVMRWRDMHDRGIPICLGVDEAIADDAVNMWSVMKTAGMIHTLSDSNYDRWPQATEILKAATSTGGKAMREPGLGTLAIGAPADLILLDLSGLPFVPLNNLHRQLVHCELGASVKLTMVDGEILYEDGAFTRIDEAALLAEAAAVFAAKTHDMDKADAKIARVLPYYRAMYDRAAQTDVGFERRLLSP